MLLPPFSRPVWLYLAHFDLYIIISPTPFVKQNGNGFQELYTNFTRNCHILAQGSDCIISYFMLNWVR